MQCGSKFPRALIIWNLKFEIRRAGRKKGQNGDAEKQNKAKDKRSKEDEQKENRLERTPSTTNNSPQTYWLALLAKNIIGPIKSAGSPHLPAGIRSDI